MNLSAILDQLDLTETEGEELARLLMSSVAGFLPDSEMDPAGARIFCEISDALSKRRPHWGKVGEKGYLWRGSFAELGPGLLLPLQQDARAQRVNAVRATRHPLVAKPPLAQALTSSPEFASFVSRLLPPQTRIESTSSFYHYYESVTDRVEPHLDTDEFALSCLLLVQHEYDGVPASRFYVNQPGHGPVEVPLAVGEAIIFYSGSVVHARSAPNKGEAVITASWGFKTEDPVLDR
jgi:hypothetical protein